MVYKNGNIVKLVIEVKFVPIQQKLFRLYHAQLPIWMKHNQIHTNLWKLKCPVVLHLSFCFNCMSLSLLLFSCGGIRTGSAEKHSVWRRSTWLCELSESSRETVPWPSCCGGIHSVMALVKKVSTVSHTKPSCLHTVVCPIVYYIQRPLEHEQGTQQRMDIFGG